MNIPDINAVCQEIADQELTKRVQDEIDEQEWLSYVAQYGPRAYGPDPDDSQGLFYWDLK